MAGLGTAEDFVGEELEVPNMGTFKISGVIGYSESLHLY